MSAPLNVALIGTKFMGRAHGNAWGSVGWFFDPPLQAVRKVVCGRDAEATADFAERWGWERATTIFEDVVADPDVHLVDVCTPNHVHARQAIAALEAGRHVACEKPLAATIDDARAMRDAARAAATGGVRSFVWFNYRRCPAVAFAHRLVRAGRVGRVAHVRATYLQDWGGADTPWSWRYDASIAGTGAHGDLNAHIVDLARFVTGDEVAEVSGAVFETFVTERADPADPARTRPCDVDDCALFLARFTSGAVGSFEATRLATGHQNGNAIEVNGDKGSLRFDFERMNELQWWDNTLPSAERGWSRIMCTNPGDHPYVDHYWPPAHLIGYEHGFLSQAADILEALGGGEPVVPLPDFEDGWEVQRVLHAAVVAAREARPVPLAEIT